MFIIKDFILKTIKGMIGEYPDFQVREYALNWHSKGKLTEDDLSEIDLLIEQYNEQKKEAEKETVDESFLVGTEESIDEGFTFESEMTESDNLVSTESYYY